MINLVVYGQVGQLNIKYGTHVNGTIILNYPDFNCRRPGKVCNRCNKGHSMHLGFICVSGHCVCIYVKQFEWKIRITHQTSASWVLLDICDAWPCLLRVMLWAWSTCFCIQRDTAAGVRVLFVFLALVNRRRNFSTYGTKEVQLLCIFGRKKD